jgi:hypothetical protein
MKKIVDVAFNPEDGKYYVTAGEGSNVNECAFACAILAKIFVKNGFIKEAKDFEDLIHKYLTDPQYDETDDNAPEAETKEEQTDGEE